MITIVSTPADELQEWGSSSHATPPSDKTSKTSLSHQIGSGNSLNMNSWITTDAAMTSGVSCVAQSSGADGSPDLRPAEKRAAPKVTQQPKSTPEMSSSQYNLQELFKVVLMHNSSIYGDCQS